MVKIKKAVIAAAGYGTRFLPATKVQPKEMLPLVDKPIIQYLVEEAVESGIEDIIIVTRAGAGSLEDHFDSNLELEYALEEDGKNERLEEVKRLQKMANFIFVRQHRDLPYGNATPLLCVENLIEEGEGFVYMFGDDLVKAETPAVKQLIDRFNRNDFKNPKASLAVQEVPQDEVERYATVSIKEGTGNELEEIREKLPPEEALSNKAQFGRFILTKRAIREARKTPPGKGGELWLTDTLNGLARKETVLVEEIEGKWLTTGDPLRYLKATVEFALEREDLGEQFRRFLEEVICQ